MSDSLDLVLINKNREILSKVESEGMKLVENNDFFRDLSEVMSDEKVQRFFDKYFNYSVYFNRGIRMYHKRNYQNT